MNDVQYALYERQERTSQKEWAVWYIHEFAVRLCQKELRIVHFCEHDFPFMFGRMNPQ